METKVVTYKSPGAYARDVKRMQAQGWQPVDNTTFLKRRSVTASVVVPFSLLKGRKSQLVITYQRQENVVEGDQKPYNWHDHVIHTKAQDEVFYAQSRAADPTSRAGEYVGPKWLGIRRNR